MGRSARKRISYVLPLANSTGGHRLGVNGLAVDPANSILYSGGRDGVICTWDLHLDLSKQEQEDRNPFADSNSPDYKLPPTQFRQQVQAHTHWINDIVLAQQDQALVSASSDISVKIWRPAAQDVLPPQTIGLHTDYVKRVASPGANENWVASGGLDHKISLWDLGGAGQKLQIAIGEDENTAKGSVYALAATSSVLASGGPESTVRVWDPRTGKRITKFVGHTDNIRDILITQDGDTLMTASSDQTVKVWSMTAGRCMYTLTMHNDSVWSLCSDQPDLSVFYSSDRSGMVAKSDVRNCAEMDEGVSVAVCQEHEGVNKVISAGEYLWTATSSSSINRWNDIETAADIALPDSYKWHRSSVATTRSRYPSPPNIPSPPTNATTAKIPFRALLRMSNAAPFPLFSAKDADASTMYSVTSTRKPSEVLLDSDTGVTVPCRNLPDFSIEGQNGLIKHFLLNDRRRVLTLDTAGEVTLWDLLQCAPIKSFGKRHLEDVAPEINSTETVAHWCAVDTRTGSLTCVLEENYCFDAEMYADELHLEEKIDFREDQRINLGKWILRYLFSNLIDEEIKRDEDFRSALVKEKANTLNRANAPSNIQIPESQLNGWNNAASGPASASTIKASNGFHLPVMTPGLSIGLATPGLSPPSQPHNQGSQPVNTLPSTAEERSSLERTQTHQSQSRTSTDYFSSAPNAPPTNSGTTNGATSADPSQENVSQSPSEPDNANQGKNKNKLFSKKFNMSFNMKKFGNTAIPEAPKPAAVDEKSEADSDSRSSKTEDRFIEDNFFGAIQRIRHAYEDQMQEGGQNVTSSITPSLPNETPVLKPPLATTILIQEDRPDSGGVADLFEGKVGSLGQQADLIEKVAPTWLADVLLRNSIPMKDIVKVSFILEPFQNTLPSIASDGNNRLNANRMLRARKILAYVAERIEPMPAPGEEDALKPEEYLELYCNGQLISPLMTLASIRAHVWRTSGDVILYYKANGRKEIMHYTASMTPPAISASAPASEGKPSSEGGGSSHRSSGGIGAGT